MEIERERGRNIEREGGRERERDRERDNRPTHGQTGWASFMEQISIGSSDTYHMSIKCNEQ